MPSPKSKNIKDKKVFYDLYSKKCSKELRALFDSLKQEATKISTDIDWGFTNTPDFRLSYKYVFCTMKPQVRKKVIELRFRVEDLSIDNIKLYLNCRETFNSKKKRRVDIYVEKNEQISEVVNLIKDIYYDNYQKLKKKKEQDELNRIEDSIEDIVESHQTSQSGQGFKITPELRKKIEEYSVSNAIKYFQKHKYTVTNVGAVKSYDLDCFKDGDTLRVEVKGTQTTGDFVILTPNEVRNAKNHKIALYVLHSIKVDKVRKTLRLSGGEEKVINPWKITEQGNLKPLSYMYFLNKIKE